MAVLPQRGADACSLPFIWTGTLIKGPERCLLVPHTCFSLATTMGKKNRGPIPCTVALCDRSFVSTVYMQQVCGVEASHVHGVIC